MSLVQAVYNSRIRSWWCNPPLPTVHIVGAATATVHIAGATTRTLFKYLVLLPPCSVKVAGATTPRSVQVAGADTPTLSK
jgi:hypothetical protein